MNLKIFKAKIAQLKNDGIITDYEIMIGSTNNFQNIINISLIARKGMKTQIWKYITDASIVYKEIKKM